MSIQKIRIILLLLTISLSYSCVGGKYTYEFNTGKKLDFSSGKWLINNTQSNSTVKYNKKLYDESYEGFKKLLGDSLIDLTSLRNIALVEPEIKFKPTQSELIALYNNSNYDFLINVKGEIISNTASGIYRNDPSSSYTTSNRASVFIEIFDLKNGIILSSSVVNAIDTEGNSEFDNDGEIKWTSRAEPMMLKAVYKLINKYDKYRVDK